MHQVCLPASTPFHQVNVYRRSTAPVGPGPNRWQWYQISTAFATRCNGRRTLRLCRPWLPQFAQSRHRDHLLSGLVSTQLGIHSLSDPPGLDSDLSSTRRMLSLHCHTHGSVDSTLNGQSSHMRHFIFPRLISGELCHQSLFPHNRTYRYLLHSHFPPSVSSIQLLHCRLTLEEEPAQDTHGLVHYCT